MIYILWIYLSYMYMSQPSAQHDLAVLLFLCLKETLFWSLCLISTISLCDEVEIGMHWLAIFHCRKLYSNKFGRSVSPWTAIPLWAIDFPHLRLSGESTMVKLEVLKSDTSGCVSRSWDWVVQPWHRF